MYGNADFVQSTKRRLWKVDVVALFGTLVLTFLMGLTYASSLFGAAHSFVNNPYLAYVEAVAAMITFGAFAYQRKMLLPWGIERGLVVRRDASDRIGLRTSSSANNTAITIMG